LLHEELHAFATASKPWHRSSWRFAEIWTALLAQTLIVEYQFASRNGGAKMPAIALEDWKGKP
jgi:hypothetical protein